MSPPRPPLLSKVFIYYFLIRHTLDFFRFVTPISVYSSLFSFLLLAPFFSPSLSPSPSLTICFSFHGPFRFSIHFFFFFPQLREKVGFSLKARGLCCLYFTAYIFCFDPLLTKCARAAGSSSVLVSRLNPGLQTPRGSKVHYLSKHTTMHQPGVHTHQ